MGLLGRKNLVNMRLDVIYCCTGIFLVLLFDNIVDYESDFVFERKRKTRPMALNIGI